MSALIFVMSISITYLMVVLVTFLTVSGSDALQCVVCDSQTDRRCETEPAGLNSTFLLDCRTWCSHQGGFIRSKGVQQGQQGPKIQYKAVPCPPDFNSCRKIQQSSSGKFSNGTTFSENRVIRACGFVGGLDQPAYHYKGNPTSKVETYTCFESGCNSGETLRPSFVNGISFLFGLLMLKTFA